VGDEAQARRSMLADSADPRLGKRKARRRWVGEPSREGGARDHEFSRCITNLMIRGPAQVSTVAELFERLNGDAWRVLILSAKICCRLMLCSTTAQRPNKRWQNASCYGASIASLSAWQGRSQRNIPFCFLRDEAVALWSDEAIAEKISEERLLGGVHEKTLGDFVNAVPTSDESMIVLFSSHGYCMLRMQSP
jgi:hypothetical protein